MKITVRHTMSFTLDEPARAVQHLLATALPTPQQRIERWSVEMPGIEDAAVFRDAFGNRAQLISLVKPEGEIVVTISGVVETIDKAGVLGRLSYDPMPGMFKRQTTETDFDAALIETLDASGGRIAMLHELMGRVHASLAPAPEAETPPQDQSQSQDGQEQSQGLVLIPPVARDTSPRAAALAFIGAARKLDIPTRYVTGYLLGEDGSASFHSWAEALDDGLGWIGFDPSNDVCPTENHIRLASGLDATGTMPIRSVPVWTAMPAETVELTVEG